MKLVQTTNQILMVRPACFGFNPDTAESNSFQRNDTTLSSEQIAQRAVEEFDSVVDTLMACLVDVFVVEDLHEPAKPDAVFPNNWISFHQNGTIVTYPMMSPVRRLEIRDDVLDDLTDHFDVKELWRIDQESSEQFLEGTGSMVLDRQNRIAYACRSPRTNEKLLQKFCDRMEYRPLLFDAQYSDGVPVYHKNVIMAVTGKLVVICLESIADMDQRQAVENTIVDSGKSMVEISLTQVGQFAGNMLQIGDSKNRPLLVMSRSARDSLNEAQVSLLEDESDILAVAIPTIEKYGGGSIRCMLAELFIPPR